MKYIKRLVGALWGLLTVLMLGMFALGIVVDTLFGWSGVTHFAAMLLGIWFLTGIPALAILTAGMDPWTSPMDVPERRRVYDMSRRFDE